MPHDAETGFGTGLRAHLRGRSDTAEPEVLPAPEPEREEASLEAAPARDSEPVVELEAALDERIQRLAELESELERRERLIAEKQASLTAAELRASQADAEARSAVEVLRERADGEADVVWQVFREGLEATTPDGSADLQTRLMAARELLAVAYGAGAEPAPIESADQIEAAADELAKLRARKAEWRQSST